MPILNGLPPHIAQVVCGHGDINTTMGCKAVYPTEAIESHRAYLARRRAIRPSAEYRAPTDQEWDEFLAHFEKRKVALGTCGRAFATPCIHEHTCLTELILVAAADQGDPGLSLNVTQGFWAVACVGRV